MKFSYPAVGRLIFASYPGRMPQAGSHLFDSPRPYPHSRLGSRPPGRRPITRTRVGHRTEPLHHLAVLRVIWGLAIFGLAPPGLGLIERICGWGDRALQECNLSTQCVRRLQVTQAPVPPCGIGFLFCSCKHGPKRKPHGSFLAEVAVVFRRAGRVMVVEGWV